jgi:hypothetical protein
MPRAWRRHRALRRRRGSAHPHRDANLGAKKDRTWGRPGYLRLRLSPRHHDAHPRYHALGRCGPGPPRAGRRAPACRGAPYDRHPACRCDPYDRPHRNHRSPPARLPPLNLRAGRLGSTPAVHARAGPADRRRTHARLRPPGDCCLCRRCSRWCEAPPRCREPQDAARRRGRDVGQCHRGPSGGGPSGGGLTQRGSGRTTGW